MTNAHKQTSRASMDDILSSIRRIIDESVTTDSEPAPKTVSPVVESPVVAERPAELLSNPPIATRKPMPEPAFGDVEAREAENQPHDHRFTPDDAEAFREVAEVLQSTASILHTRDVDTAPAETPPAPDAPSSANEVIFDSPRDESDEDKTEAENTEIVGPDPVDLVKTEPSVEPLKDQIVPLVSSAASRSIAQTLAALDEVLKERTGEDLKSTTEEMLKPMLAEWLDENLPSMVERLVRQEIERIARGEPRAA